MKKMFILASLALVGVACSKDDNDGGNRINPSEEPAVYPTEKTGNDQNYTQTTYTVKNNNQVEKIVTEVYQAGVKNTAATQTTTITYASADKKYPSVVEKTYNGGSNKNKIEYSYNEKNQITEMKNTVNGSTSEVVKFEYNADGKISKAIHSGYEITYEYPNASTVIEKNSNQPNTTKTYTLTNGNVTKILDEHKDDQGVVRNSNITEYEYDTTVKNPEVSLERRLLNVDYFYNYNPYKANYSPNVYTKEVHSYNDNGHKGEKEALTYTYKKNDKGYPTEKTEKGRNMDIVTTYAY
ncbi:hypothetical protein [Capnocytophaga gingivalis]